MPLDAWLSVWYGEFVSIAHAATVCDSEEVSFGEFISLFPDRSTVRFHVQVIRDESFDARTATLEVWDAALRSIQQQGADANIDTQFPDFVAGLFKKAALATNIPRYCGNLHLQPIGTSLPALIASAQYWNAPR